MTKSCVNALVLALVGCQAGVDPLGTAPVEPPARFERDMVLRQHMRENFGVLRAVEDLLIHGQLDPARELAEVLARGPVEPGTESWPARVVAVRDRARQLAAAPSIDEACRREARLAAACADCHRDAAAMMDLEPPGRPPEDLDTIDARMARHRWATERLWEGLVGNADEAWVAGLDVLAATPLPWRELSGDRANLARRLQHFADQARRAPGGAGDATDERARLYGEMLVTCAACHATSPPPPPTK